MPMPFEQRYNSIIDEIYFRAKVATLSPSNVYKGGPAVSRKLAYWRLELHYSNIFAELRQTVGRYIEQCDEWEEENGLP